MNIVVSAAILSFLSSACAYPDFFTLDESDFKKSTFGPADWDLVRCKKVSDCPGWPTNWKVQGDFIPYDPTSNMCMDCSKSDDGLCYKHIQSPIDLVKEVTAFRECNDRHRMRYWKGECRFNSTEILPHVLRAYQPQQKCSGKSQPQIDYSKGFPEPWILSHTDIAVPSQHTLDGKRYDAEVMLTHSYSFEKFDRLVGTVSVLLEQGKVRDRYDFLDLYLERWMKEENQIHNKCFGSDSKRARRLESEFSDAFKDQPEDFGDDLERRLDDHKVHDPKHPDDESQPKRVSKHYFDREWHPYDWLSKVNTEYYYRYQGSLTEPPCIQANHWRVMKDPILVAPSQIRTLNTLIKNRVDPQTCKSYTAAIVPNEKANKVAVNRPIQTTTMRHKLVHCECNDWISKSEQDKEYCELSTKKRGVKKFLGVSGQSLSSTPSFVPADAVVAGTPLRA